MRTLLTLSYKILGEELTSTPKPPVLILHGIISNKTQWEGIGKTIQIITQRAVVAVDLRNHGDSPNTTSHQYTDLATDILQLVKKFDMRQVSLIGHGMGGRAAMCVALMEPQIVAGLLVVDISPISTPPSFLKPMETLLTAMKQIQFKKLKMVSMAKTEARRQLKQFVTDDYIMNAILSNIRRKPDGSIGWICNLNALIDQQKYWISFPQSLKNKKYYGPTMFVGGELSDFIPPEDINGIRKIFPKADIKYVPKSGHLVQIHDPKTFLELTISFIKTNVYYDPLIKK